MKKLALIFGTAALLLAGCSQEESIPGENSTPNAIAFGTFVQKATKGTPVTGTTLPNGGVFLVMGNTSTGGAMDPLDFMRQPVTYTTLGGYTYSPTKYWPASGSVNFFAVYPADIANITPATLGDLGQPAFTYTIPEDPTKQKNLMLASAPSQTLAGSGVSGVSFTFTHQLTKIGFKAKLNAPYGGAYIRIDSIQVGNLAEQVEFVAMSGNWTMITPGAATTNNK
ncbi:MAG: fimbrillin family protein [Mangrovibacterium sp.]